MKQTQNAAFGRVVNSMNILILHFIQNKSIDSNWIFDPVFHIIFFLFFNFYLQLLYYRDSFILDIG